MPDRHPAFDLQIGGFRRFAFRPVHHIPNRRHLHRRELTPVQQGLKRLHSLRLESSVAFHGLEFDLGSCAPVVVTDRATGNRPLPTWLARLLGVSRTTAAHGVRLGHGVAMRLDRATGGMFRHQMGLG